jgi:hypothetical protein
MKRGSSASKQRRKGVFDGFGGDRNFQDLCFKKMTFLEFIGIGEKADEGKRRMGKFSQYLRRKILWGH